ncbi:G patch domain-containing protein 11 [Salvia hispanica]|uniref:G patch domain-containing protein 11 n=1 Tax=Salvia hispanica TaxID=49212 RepID=UPI002008FB9B|nr:G patch domain-containing protein 11 [Salvia hispanica]XP_047976767.1 G patch domain-containing protein 11 [Salvia hispanica]
MAVDDDCSAGLGTTRASHLRTSASTPIDSSNIGFQLLKKQGWKEGTGLGVSEQGRLEPIATAVKKNKRGVGAEEAKVQIKKSKVKKDKDDPESPKIKVRGASKKIRKVQEFEKKMQEKEFDRDFFRMFWPDNV